jgi:hypothetical protein
MEEIGVFRTKSKGNVHIYNDDDERLVAKTPSGEIIGELRYRQMDIGDERMPCDYHKASGIDLTGPDGTNAYVGQGIGRGLVKTLNELIRGRVVVQHPNDDHKDGDQLIDDGSGFWMKMHDEGLCVWDNGFEEEVGFPQVEDND